MRIHTTTNLYAYSRVLIVSMILARTIMHTIVIDHLPYHSSI